eukprot:1156287-Lingulodinium_polyedra.AAC.1
MGRNAAQAAMDQLKRLAKQGRPYLLQAYKEKRTWAEKRDFVQKLAVDKNCTFLEVEEQQWASEEGKLKKATGF